MHRARKKFTSLLVLLVLAVWGTIVFNVVESMTVEEKSGLSDSGVPDTAAKMAMQKYSYVSGLRDPFQFTAPHRKDTLKRTALVKPSWSPPPFKLTGILSAGKHHTAMIEGPGGSVWFLKEKDTLSGVQILKINEKSVSYSYQKKKTDWILERP